MSKAVCNLAEQRSKIATIDRLDEMDFKACHFRCLAVFVTAIACHRDQDGVRRRRIGPQASRQGQAVDVGKTDVEDE